MSKQILEKYKKALKNSKSEEETDTILNELYEEGVENGTNEV